MHSTAPHFTKLHFDSDSSKQEYSGNLGSTTNSEIPVDQLPFLVEDWLADCQMRQQSHRTIELRKIQTGRLCWFLSHRNSVNCGTSELRAFFAYLTTAHTREGGRWGYGNHHHALRPLRPATVRTYYSHLGSFFNWLAKQQIIGASPLAVLSPPQARPDQIQPFSKEQVEAIQLATRRSGYPQRDEAITMFLFDTGVRATELCSLKMQDVDLYACHAKVLGKGNKFRSVYFGRRCGRVV